MVDIYVELSYMDGLKKMQISLDIAPVGVKFLKEKEMPGNFDLVKNTDVPSYCAAIKILQDEENKYGVLVTKNSIKVCKWCFPILGLKKPEKKLGRKITPILEEPVEGVFVFDMNTPNENHPLSDSLKNPDSVIIRSSKENFADIINQLNINNFTRDYDYDLKVSNITIFDSQTKYSKRTKIRRSAKKVSIRLFNWAFNSKLLNNRVMNKFFNWALKKYSFSRMMEPILSKTMTMASVCRNSSVIPYLTQKGNVSYIDGGGVSDWGGNSRKNMIMGLPYHLYQQLEPDLVF
jgi:hypothetical protein